LQVKEDKRIVRSDFDRIYREDWWPLSFLSLNDYDVNITYSVFLECLKWRKSFNIHNISLLELRSLFMKKAMYLHGEDLQGRRILWINLKQIEATERNFTKLLIYWLERNATETCGAPLQFLFDMSGSGLQNLEVEAVKFALHACKYYFPGCMGGLLVYECPPIFDALCKLVLSWIDIRAHCRLRRITRDTVTKYVSPENLPFHMGGKVWYFFPIFCNSSTDKIFEIGWISKDIF
uniref:CRAL-TRIO domain-containing protein n=1 Tax=Enterobius vermicularis TaxID=51028 RepID=A0A0N4V5G0_ENTVE